MARKSTRPILNEVKKGQITGILAVGCSRATAARIVGCSPRTIYNAAQRDPEFAEQLRLAENRAEVECLKNIQQAARQERYWRAAAWMLERRNPNDFGQRQPGALSLREVEQLVLQVAGIICECMPAGRYRQRLLKRLNELVKELLGPDAQGIGRDEPQSPA